MGRWGDKYVIGLTGNIAVGKSVVRQMLQHLGAYTIDADGLSHQAMAPGAPAYKPTVEMFGRYILDSEGRINRARLGNIVFTFPDALVELEKIVHPVVNQAIQTLVSRARQRIIVVEAIKLLESNLASTADAIWVVDASPGTQLKRLMQKRGLTEAEARKRISAQRPQADKLARADVIVMNDGNVEETWRQVQTAWNEIRRQLTAAAPAHKPGQTAAPPSGSTGTGQLRPLAQVTIPQAPHPAPPAVPPPPAGTGQLTPLRSLTTAAPRSNNIASGPFGAKPSGSAGLGAPQMLSVTVRRGMPGSADVIARFISRVSGKMVDRMDIMLAFGQKSYLLAQDQHENVVALIGWQVENLITRADEFYIDPLVPRAPVIGALVSAIEEASRELQSEVAFIFLPDSAAPEITQAFVGSGYQLLRLEEIKFPAWREAAHEMMHGELQGLIKQLRADRVMKPI